MGVEHVVQLGETVRSIALAHGIASWQSVYSHPRNAALRRARPNPNALHAGDRVWIDAPADPPIVYQGTAVPCRTGRSYTFTAPPAVPLALRLVDREGHALPNCRYELRCGSSTVSGTSDGDGNLRESVPMRGARCELRVWLHDSEEPAWRLSLDLNTAHARDSLAGVQARLTNLGFYRGPIDGERSDELEAALRAFQHQNHLDESGDLDDATRRALRARHPV